MSLYYISVCYLATSPLYRDLYVQLAWSALGSTQNKCSVGDWRSSNQEKRLANGAAWGLDGCTHTTYTKKRWGRTIVSSSMCAVNVSIPVCLLFPFEVTGVNGFWVRPTARWIPPTLLFVFLLFLTFLFLLFGCRFSLFLLLLWRAQLPAHTVNDNDRLLLKDICLKWNTWLKRKVRDQNL